MLTLIIRLPDSSTPGLKEVARASELSVNKFIEELTIIAIAQQVPLTRFTLCASRCDVDKGLSALGKLYASFK